MESTSLSTESHFDESDVSSTGTQITHTDPLDMIFERVDDRRIQDEMYCTRFRNIEFYAPPYDPRSIWPPSSSHLNKTYTYERADEDFSRIYSREVVIDHNRSIPSLSRIPVATLGSLYQPLHDGSHVRLLELEAGEFEAPLTFHFHYADLQQTHLDYEAISYVWGEQPLYDGNSKPERRVVSCGDHSIEVSFNLATALTHLRWQDRNRLIWVDALCINQSDNKERGHQVTLMSSIYRQASSVIVWLYDEATHSPFDEEDLCSYGYSEQHHDTYGSRIFGAVCTIVNTWLAERKLERVASFTINSKSFNMCEVQQPFPQDGFTCEYLATPISLTDFQRRRWFPGGDAPAENDLLRLWQAVEDLYNCPWFWRVWTVQELVLASHAVAKFGNVEIKWHWIGLAAAILRNNCYYNVKNLSIGGVYNAYLLFRMSAMSDLEPIELTFLQLLRLTRQLASKDPRDRVYGLLGIKTVDNDPSNGSLFIRPDYNTSRASLWLHLACKFINDTSSLSILSSVQHEKVKDSFDLAEHASYRRNNRSLHTVLEQGLPSWVPRWDFTNRVSLLPWDSEERFSCSSNIPLSFRQPPETGSLVIQGVHLGVVGCIFEEHINLLVDDNLGDFFQTETGTHLLHRTLSAGRNMRGSLVSQSVSTAMEFLLDGIDFYPRNLNWLRPGSYARMYAEQQIDFSVTLDPERPFEDGFKWRKEHDLVRAAEHKEQARQVLDNRKLCLTINGYLVLAPDILQEGDILCTLAGADLPLLLRPYQVVANSDPNIELPPDSREKSGYPRYVVVGDCYVEGLMYGETNECLQRGGTVHGPVPCELVSKYVLELAAKSFNPKYPQREKTESEAQQLSKLLGAGKTAIEQQLKKTIELEWLEIV